QVRRNGGRRDGCSTLVSRGTLVSEPQRSPSRAASGVVGRKARRPVRVRPKRTGLDAPSGAARGSNSGPLRTAGDVSSEGGAARRRSSPGSTGGRRRAGRVDSRDL